MRTNLSISSAEKLYHFQVYLPEKFKEDFTYILRYSPHAQAEISKDRYCPKTGVKLPAALKTKDALLVEVGVDAITQKVTKRVYRVPVTPKLDLVLVVTPTEVVKTVWLNEHNDRHTTLNRAKYVTH